jgi:hypothetical protein
MGERKPEPSLSFPFRLTVISETPEKRIKTKALVVTQFEFMPSLRGGRFLTEEAIRKSPKTALF